MSLEICSPCLAHKTVIWNLFQFYCYDTSAEEGCDVEETGFYSLSQDYFAQYWTAPSWSAHLLLWDGAIAGFALIETSDALSGALELADLFIMKRFRRHGIGRQVVRHFMSSRAVPWTVVVYDEAVGATAFWNSIFQDPSFTPSRQVPDPDDRMVTTHVLEPTIAAKPPKVKLSN
ncbi:GNAT family N-acetyltransferase [Paucibacter sp. AS339]|uniref:GNAT family N-acetyltransferase n=1 Tax=Paucibacter hankyongi TaxID=3133434 RepID=UPI0030B6764F